ncbi:hypothetical protein [Tychonema sp. LEGE 07203]|uniref:hypothetical protein n=1 Tax=Tychonema sp. LEGE 07203 TaxID=1828671 RepID=UPI001881CC9F|nr:hypothetical protein [Tychonema sp. LEGE 07203]MBE9095809.1 hypothetical protein [Tychonema sp. LEGE 07203]
MATDFKCARSAFNKKIGIKEAVNCGGICPNLARPDKYRQLINTPEPQSAIINCGPGSPRSLPCNRKPKNQGIDRRSTQQHSSWFDALKKLPPAR